MNTFNGDHREAAKDCSAQGNVHRRPSPLNRGMVGRQAPDNDRTEPAKQAEVFDPVKCRQKEIGAAAQDADLRGPRELKPKATSSWG